MRQSAQKLHPGCGTLGRGRPGLAFLGLLGLGAALLATSPLRAQGTDGAVITNGVVSLGVDNEGQLIVPFGTPSSGGQNRLGLRLNAGQFEALSPGCDCEGWGVAIPELNVTGSANNDDGGPSNLTLVSFTATADSAESVTRVPGHLEVRHRYTPVPQTQTPFLYKCEVTITNIQPAGGMSIRPDLTLKYRRLMDWDIEPTPFEELVTIQRGGASNLVASNDGGFSAANPLIPLDFERGETDNADVIDSGPEDHGAAFDFQFPLPDPTKSVTFNIFYGAAPSETDALRAIGAVGAEVFSFGQSSGPNGGSLGTPATFIFGFTGVGGKPVLGEVSNVSVTNITQTTARVTWKTVNPVVGAVNVGSNPSSLSRTIAETGPKRTEHEVIVTGLPNRAPLFVQVADGPVTVGGGSPPGKLPSQNPIRAVVSGRSRVNGLTPGISVFFSGAAACLEATILNTCTIPAKDVTVKELFIETGGKRFDLPKGSLPFVIGKIEARGAVNLKTLFPAEAFPTAPAVRSRIVFAGDKRIGASPRTPCTMWRDFISLPVLIKPD